MQNNKEYLQVVNCFNEIIEGNFLKQEIHQNGLWHRTINFIVIDPVSREIIFQDKNELETLAKSDFFVKLNGGHLQIGESIEDGFRELKEELGLTAKEFYFLGKMQVSFEIEKFKNNEFMYFYLVSIKDAFEIINFEDKEVSSIIRFGADEALKLLLNQKEQLKATARNSQFKTTEVSLTKNSFKNFTDNHMYLKLILAAKRFLDGENPNLILV